MVKKGYALYAEIEDALRFLQKYAIKSPKKYLGRGTYMYEMFAKNCEIFREVGRYAHRWYLSDLYLKELSENPYFKLVTVKYERLAGTMSGGNQVKKCLP